MRNYADSVPNSRSNNIAGPGCEDAQSADGKQAPSETLLTPETLLTLMTGLLFCVLDGVDTIDDTHEKYIA
jgi:hypothetical protein